MTTLFVVLLTAIPVAAWGYLGSRLGGRRMARSLGGFVLAGGCGAALGFAGLRFGWSRPFGLLTPAVAALLATIAIWCVALRWLATDRAHAVSGRGRLLGAGLGTVGGVLVAGSLWIVAALGEGVVTAPEPTQTPASASRGWTYALVRTANRGFVRHLPVLGPLGDEVEATVAILNSSPEARRKFARGRRWERLTRLASYRDLARDGDVNRDLASLRRGNVLALYRLQRNPRVITFMQEEEVRAMLPELRPSVLAHELEALESSSAR